MKPNPILSHLLLLQINASIGETNGEETIAASKSFNHALVSQSIMQSKDNTFGRRSPEAPSTPFAILELRKAMKLNEIWAPFFTLSPEISMGFTEAQIVKFVEEHKMHLKGDTGITRGQTLFLCTDGRNALSLNKSDAGQVGAVDYDLRSWPIDYRGDGTHQIVLPLASYEQAVNLLNKEFMSAH
jgi:hypothetical protein